MVGWPTLPKALLSCIFLVLLLFALPPYFTPLLLTTVDANWLDAVPDFGDLVWAAVGVPPSLWHLYADIH
jgi:hypothetical protein